ncbi:MAG: SCP2 sterol-binding domain-containing protein [Microthrixaceae bacterium]
MRFDSHCPPGVWSPGVWSPGVWALGRGGRTVEVAPTAGSLSGVVQYLSDEWFQQAGAAISASEALRAAATASEDVTIQYEVTGAPSGKQAYTIWLRDGAAGLDVGASKGAEVTFALDYPTAVQVAKGELSAQAAFMQGKMKLGGDVGVLIRAHAAIDSLSDVLADLRSNTEY